MGWWNTVTPTEGSSLHERLLPESSPALSQDLQDDITAKLFESARQLLAAFDAEHERSKRYPKDITQVVSYLEEVSLLRQRVDKCAQEYCALLTECGFPNVAVKDVVQRGNDSALLDWQLKRPGFSQSARQSSSL